MSEQTPSSSDRLRQMASSYEGAVSQGHAEQMAARAVARARGAALLPSRVPRLIAGLSVAAAMVTALGAVSGDSLPGDSLYAVSRVYEEVGDWVGMVDPVEERLHEVLALTDRGDVGRAALAAEEALIELAASMDLPISLSSERPSETGSRGAAEDAGTATVAADRVNALRVAAELLLSSVSSNGDSIEEAATSLADAVSRIADPATEVPPAEPTSTTAPPDSTTTTGVTQPSSTTTAPGPSTTVPATTTTTSGTQDGGLDDHDGGPGPIFIPPGS